MIYRNVLKAAERELDIAGVPEAELNAWYLLAEAGSLTENFSAGDEVKSGQDKERSFVDRAWFINHEMDEAEDDFEKRLQDLIEERKTGRPLEYIIGRTEFMGLEFYTDERALIPRQDTECLVEEALQFTEGRDVLDMCTGTGCIAVSLAALGKCRSVSASDISEDALSLAKKNAKKNNVKIEFIQSNLFEKIDKKYDVITCNPPYIKRDIIPTLMREVREFEPAMALDGGEDGLDFYKKIVNELPEFLNEKGMIFFEIGYDQGKAVTELLMKRNCFGNIEVKKDLAGNDRVVVARKDV